jgi:galactokinase/mevalonate kinase-like predicted kinase
MQKLLSLPPNLVESFCSLQNANACEWFVSSDPEGAKVGSGGGTAWLLAQDWQSRFSEQSFDDYLKGNKKIIIHAGGQSRRLPGYAPSGKILTPIPVFRWSRGQRLNQNLLDLQLPLYERIMYIAPDSVNTLIASGDVLINAPVIPSKIPDADVVCLGIWVDPHLASRHGVFFTPREDSSVLDFMLQKPSHHEIENFSDSHLFMMDIGVWILSDKAVHLLMQKCNWNNAGFKNGVPDFYDLYSSFGTGLGIHPSRVDEEIGQLSVAIIPLEGGEFFHYGTSLELITSTERIQNKVQDQRSILHHRIKPHPSLFVQNAKTDIHWEKHHHHIWIENCNIPNTWSLTHNHIITGVPENTWQIDLCPDVCMDIVPIGEDDVCIRPYGMNDIFSGDVHAESTNWMGQPVKKWLDDRGITIEEANLGRTKDIQKEPLFPVVGKDMLEESLVKWMISSVNENRACRDMWLNSKRISAEEISAKANLTRLNHQREQFRNENLKVLAENHQRSVFYQSDLSSAANEFARNNIVLPSELDHTASPMTRIQDSMFRAEVERLKGQSGEKYEKRAFEGLRELIVSTLGKKSNPQLSIFSDQIVWGRSPVRLDIAGGWSDTPPYCIQNGGKVVNLAANLNGQPPLQVFIRRCDQHKIVFRSIDNGVSEEISTWNELGGYNDIGSAFTIPRAALSLAGFHPDFCGLTFASLEEQLKAFGGGIEISLLAAVPKGSGLGTSSILAATLLGALSDFCNLQWDKHEICHRTLILEQLLTTGGGWQDQFGGVFGGVKLLESTLGYQDKINVKWMPEYIFTNNEYHPNWLLYYTGITRVAKNILAEIVRGMFLNDSRRLNVLGQIRDHAVDMFDAVQCNDYQRAAMLVNRSWELNKLLDSGTNTDDTQVIIRQIEDYSLGLKLLGAGGGGYMLIGAKDAECARRIKETLLHNPPNARARFVNMDVNMEGFQVTRS